MTFKSSQEVEDRLANPAPLTSEEIRDLFPWMNQVSESGMRRLNAHLALENLEAVRKFELSSIKLTKKSWASDNSQQRLKPNIQN
jgi:hypothetical protein